MRDVPGTLSVYAERVMGGNYLDFTIDREAIARYGLTVGDVQDVIQTAIGGMNITTTVEGLERYPVNLRYSRELRDNLPALEAVLVPTPTGQQIPLGQLATLRYVVGPPSIKTRRRAAQRLDLCGSPRHRRRHLRRRMRKRSWRRRSSCRRDTPSPGAASTSTCSAPSSGSCT